MKQHFIALETSFQNERNNVSIVLKQDETIRFIEGLSTFRKRETDKTKHFTYVCMVLLHRRQKKHNSDTI